MTVRKRRQPTPGFRLPPPFNPMDGERAATMVPGVTPYCAMMQVAAEDTHDDYVVCRGYDPRFRRFFDYDANDLGTKPGIAVGKPFGSRVPGIYEIGQIFPALIPLTRIGQTPGVAADTAGHPADLDEIVEILYDENAKPINWLFLESGTHLRRFELKTSLSPSLGIATAHPLEGDGNGSFAPDLAVGSEFTVYDVINRFAGWGRVAGQRSGAWGYVRWHSDSGWAEIINMEQAAKYINFTLTEDMGYTINGQASVTVDDWYDGTDPSIAYATIKVYDPQNLHPNVISGAKGKARLDERSDQYHIVEMGQSNGRNFACVQTGWTNTKAGSVASETVSVKSCDYDDSTTETGDAFNVQTVPRPGLDTAMFTVGTAAGGKASIIEWADEPGGDRVIVSSIWDDPFGTVKWEAVAEANIRDGWKLCDGTNGTVDLQGMFIMSIDNGVLASADEDTIGDSDGFSNHGIAAGVPENDHGDHTDDLVVATIGDHDGHSTTQVAQAVDVDDHPEHVHIVNGSVADGPGGNPVVQSGAETEIGVGAGGANALDHTVVPNVTGEPLSHSIHAAAPGDNDLEHGTTDNRPRYYVLAAIQRVK